ncbi:hypothetical protein T459_29250 [Capsicum annuum]|uniref:Uncharacterized protein n=1 Tax=Capsicum annuum TaxID=4072 RepID=A0A2G2Y503_CAPAN|nr:hypothetical protein T459_29250 [Capsicum annuum]
MKVDEGEEVTELEENLWDPAECLPMLGHGLETESEGLITPHVSIYAMNGLYNFRTMRVNIYLKGKAIHVLIDSGSTHNFLDLETAKWLGCVLTSISPFSVSVANVKKIHSHHLCKALVWKMQGVSFE